MTFTEITKALNEVSQISSTNERISWLKKHDDKDFKEVLSWYLDSSRITGIAEKKYDKVDAASDAGCFVTQDVKTFADVIRYLDCNHTGKDEDVANVKWLGEQICTNEDDKVAFRKLVCKNFPMGLQEGLVNKAFPGLIPTYEVMLAQKFYSLNEKQKAKTFTPGREFVLQEKLDGGRLTVHKENGNVRCVSRQGKLIIGLVDIENDVLNMKEDNFVLDGEILLTDRVNIPSKLQYKATMKIISTKAPEKHGVTLNVFDWVSTTEWKAQKSTKSYSERYNTLNTLLEKTAPAHIHLCENIYKGSDVSVIDKLIVDAKAKEWEGLMVRFTDSVYSWKRTNDLLKVKPFKEMDFYITGVYEGTNSNAGRLGGFNCEVETKTFGKLTVDVGGGYSEEERINFWNRRNELIGRIISVQYFEITQNTTTMKYSVRFPEFLELKEAGSKINNDL